MASIKISPDILIVITMRIYSRGRQTVLIEANRMDPIRQKVDQSLINAHFCEDSF